MTIRTGSTADFAAVPPTTVRMRVCSPLVWALLACSIGTALAAPPVLTSASFLDIDAQMMLAGGHANEEHRLRGLKSYQNRDYGDAKTSFEQAAYHADKYSQHYLSLMHWHGVGMAPDPVQAYIWADLAAERGSSKLLAIREKIWAQLTVQQRAQAQALGADAYARYGDPYTQPRAEVGIRRFKRNMTGSRAGAQTMLLQTTGRPQAGGGPGGPTNGDVSAADLYAENRTRGANYWQSQDRILEGGRVEVGQLTVERENGGEPR